MVSEIFYQKIYFSAGGTPWASSPTRRINPWERAGYPSEIIISVLIPVAYKNVPLDKFSYVIKQSTRGTPSGEEARRLRWRVKPC